MGALTTIMKIIGLTGGIATGKSSASRLLQKLGFQVIDADAVVHELQTIGSPLLAEIATAFGSTVLHHDGSLNRGELGQMIFGDEPARAKLDAIMHPAVRREFQGRIQQSKAEILFLDVPLLFEAGFDDMTDVNLVIRAQAEMQLSRLQKRDGFTEKEAQARINSQMPMSEKVARADYVIDNNGSLCELEENVKKFISSVDAT